jgi:HK97 family phage prohead protease
MDRIEIKLASDDFDAKTGEFSGYGAIFGNLDSYGDVIAKGAFKTTLREWEAKGDLPPMLLQHGQRGFGPATDGIPIGVWTVMEENAKGLKVRGRIDPLDTDEGKKVYAGLKNRTLKGLSIGFKPVKFSRGVKPADPPRTLEEIHLMEVSIVTFPANDKALVTGVKAAESVKTIREFEDFLRDVGGFSHAKAKAIAASGFKGHSEPRDEDGGELADLIRRNINSMKG